MKRLSDLSQLWFVRNSIQISRLRQIPIQSGHRVLSELHQRFVSSSNSFRVLGNNQSLDIQIRYRGLMFQEIHPQTLIFFGQIRPLAVNAGEIGKQTQKANPKANIRHLVCKNMGYILEEVGVVDQILHNSHILSHHQRVQRGDVVSEEDVPRFLGANIQT